MNYLEWKNQESKIFFIAIEILNNIIEQQLFN